MGQEIITLEDLEKFRLQLLEDLTALLKQPNYSQATTTNSKIKIPLKIHLTAMPS
jgi:hypothetical protein